MNIKNKTNCDKVLELFYKDGIGITQEGKKLKEFIIIGLDDDKGAVVNWIRNTSNFLDRDELLTRTNEIKALEYFLDSRKRSLERYKARN